jgi:RecA-family ATPase
MTEQHDVKLSSQNVDDDERHERGEAFATEGDAVELGAPSADASDVFADKWKTLMELGGIEWFSKAPPRRRWLLELPGDDAETGESSTGILPLGKVGMLAAAGAAGKTMALVQLALAVATGRKWLDTYTTPNPGHVLLALGEEDAEEVRRRVYNAARVMALTDEQQALAAQRIVVLPLAGTRVGLTEGSDSKPTSALNALRSRLESSGHEWRLIVLDPLSRFAGCDTEKDNAAATGFIEAVETLVRMPGQPTVLLAHHTNKNARDASGNARDTNAVRGATGLTDGARWVAQLDPDKDHKDRVMLAFSKANYSRQPSSVMLVRQDGGALRAETKNERDVRAQEREQREAERHESTPPNGRSKTNGNVHDIHARKGSGLPDKDL